MSITASGSPSKTIAIIGAGVSGLQAARTLLKHPKAASFNVIVFEARDRIGGRVTQKSDWGFSLDYGNLLISLVV
jgi:phytoene dehydrogenase-like protein